MFSYFTAVVVERKIGFFRGIENPGHRWNTKWISNGKFACTRVYCAVGVPKSLFGKFFTLSKNKWFMRVFYFILSKLEPFNDTAVDLKYFRKSSTIEFRWDVKILTKTKASNFHRIDEYQTMGSGSEEQLGRFLEFWTDRGLVERYFWRLNPQKIFSISKIIKSRTELWIFF